MNNIDRLNNEILLALDFDANDISDGDHTFGDLYKHRHHLFIALCKKITQGANLKVKKGYRYQICISKLHNDGDGYEGWFIMQLETCDGQISYHLPNQYWNKCASFSEVLDKAHKWDGHTSDDTLNRLLNI